MELGGWEGFDPFFHGRSLGGFGFASEAVESVASRKVNFSIPDGGGGETSDAGAGVVFDFEMGEDFRIVVVWFDDGEGAVKPGGVDFAIAVSRGGVDLIRG